MRVGGFSNVVIHQMFITLQTPNLLSDGINLDLDTCLRHGYVCLFLFSFTSVSVTESPPLWSIWMVSPRKHRAMCNSEIYFEVIQVNN